MNVVRSKKSGVRKVFDYKKSSKQTVISKLKVQTEGVFSINQVGLAETRKFIAVDINGVSTQLQLDCASDVTIIPEDVYLLLHHQQN